VKAVNRLPAQQLQDARWRPAFVHVVGIQQYTGIGMAGFGGHVQGLTAMVEIRRRTPDFQLRNDSHLAAQFQDCCVSNRCLIQVQMAAGTIRTGGRRGNVRAANLRQHVHIAF
jgi:hypothetical protein